MIDLNELLKLDVDSKLTISVIAEDSLYGEQWRAFKCPFARAVARAIGVPTDDLSDQRYVGVAGGDTSIWAEDENENILGTFEFEHDRRTIDVINLWDSKRVPLPPGEYVITCTRAHKE